MGAYEKFEYVTDRFIGEGEQGDWSIFNKMFDQLQAEFHQNLMTQDWSIYDNDNGTASIFNAESEEIIIVHYNTDRHDLPGSIAMIDLIEEEIKKMLEVMECPLCGDGEMEYQPLDNPRSSTTYMDKRVTHAWICDTCPAVLMEWYGSDDDKVLSERLNGKG